MQIKLNKKYLNTHKEVIMYTIALILIILSSFNLVNYFLPKKVLGVASETIVNSSSEDFWLDFLEKHPSYIPGWLEIGMEHKVKEIDPNYIIP